MTKKEKEELYFIVKSWILSKKNEYFDKLHSKHHLSEKEVLEAGTRIIDFIEFCFSEQK